ncbi:oxidoreductase [Teredinibacter turnerae T7901]|uniref:Oxidoreductase n=1 Tax=Teredinibacter turnerae (strain ATCC 39867 / T7901) TaxID=377629 RepID=C5BNE4_TERTT|nr:Gfo/Idh/MocA family oxidoreductase [Teredinibacter turnerae]ACR12874.1 oxidoreductase [Teredinibacter turnerae T7901]
MFYFGGQMQTTNNKLRWGILSTANIAREKVIPAIQASAHNEVVAICSRSQSVAEQAAAQLNIPFAFGDYEQLLNADQVDIIYNPLPNHLHVPWSIRALEAGKHVLCEKPIGLDVADTQKLLDAAAQFPQLKVMEAFMYRFHPQWAIARQLIEEGRIGKVHGIEAMFTYFNRDPANVRNMPGIGGGGLLDIGCYCISASRYLLAKEPVAVTGKLVMDDQFGVDIHAQGLLDFGDVRASFYCSTQSEPSQRVYVSGEKGSLLIDFPFYQPDDCPAQVTLFKDRVPEVFTLPVCNHYTLQADALAQSIREDTPVPTPLSDALANMKVIDAVFASGSAGGWVEV